MGTVIVKDGEIGEEVARLLKMRFGEKIRVQIQAN